MRQRCATASFPASIDRGALRRCTVLLRALTEEDHLRRVDGEYAASAAKVRYRFIPGVY